MENLKFIGLKYKTEIEKQSILHGYDEYQIDKIRWVNSRDIADGTKDTYLQHYNNYFHNTEKKYGKDLKFFTKDEIEDIILKKCVNLSLNTIKPIFTFCNTYCKYCLSKGDIKVNPCKEIKPARLVEKSEFLKSRLFGMDYFYDICEKMMKTTNNYNNIKPLLLARYDVNGKKSILIRTLKYKDIDIDNMVINIRLDDGSIIRKLPIDDRFIKLLTELTDENIKSNKNSIFKSNEYILKTVVSNGKIMNYNTMNTAINTACYSINEHRISVGNLLFTRYIEILLSMRKKRKLTTDDIRTVVKEFNIDENITEIAITTLKRSYQTLINDSVSYRNQDDLSDFNSKDFAEDKAKELGLNINDSLFITNYRANNLIDIEDSRYQQDVYNSYIDTPSDSDISNFEYSEGDKKETIPNGNNSPIYPRDHKVGLNALKLGNYECSAKKEHKTFIAKTTSKNFVELHHLIPIKYYDKFDVDIDNEANIITLCPNCHSLLHYGTFEEKETLIVKLYVEHIDNLKKVGLNIELDKLLSMYR